MSVPCCASTAHLLALALLTLAFAPSVRADDLEDQPITPVLQPGEPDPPPADIPVLPETRVEGRPDAFPANPLPADAVESANLTPTPIERTGSSVTVISEEEIARTKQIFVQDVLRGRLGVDVVQQGNVGGFSSVFIRGANSQQTKVIIDGIWVNDPSNAGRSFDFSALTVDDIERIEVLRGPQSTLYGSDAIGGVINVVTKRGQGPLTARAGVLGGSYGTSREWLSASGGDERVYYSFGASYQNINGFSQASELLGNTEADGYRNGTMSGRFGYNVGESLNIDYVFRWIDAQTEVDDEPFGGGGIPVDQLGRVNFSRQFFQRVQLQSFVFDGAIEQRLGFSYTDVDRKDPLGFVTRFEGQSRLVDYVANLLLYEGNLVSVGANYYAEDADTSFDPLTTQNMASVFVQEQLEIGPNFTGTAGARWDDHSRFGSASTYRMTGTYRVNEYGTRLLGSIGTGFRAPSLAEFAGAQFNGPGFPTDLKPETSKGWDYGLEQQLTQRVAVGATYFRNDFTNLIVVDPFFNLLNIGSARASGVESFIRYELDDNSYALLNYTVCDTLDHDTGKPLLRRPQDKAGLTLGSRSDDDRGDINLYLYYVGDRLDRNDRVLKDYVSVNVSGRYDLTEWCELVGRIDNLFDEQYEEVFAYGVPGLSGYAGVNILW